MGEKSEPQGGTEKQSDSLPSNELEQLPHRILRIEERHGRTLLLYEGMIQQRKVRFLLDSGATGCFIATELATRLKLQKTKKVRADTVQLANGRKVESAWLTQQAFQIGSYRDVDMFHLVDLEGLDVVLGMSWLRRVNPQIDWTTGVSRVFKRTQMHLLCPAEDKETRQLAASLFISHLQLKRAVATREPIYLLNLKRVDAEEREGEREETASQADTLRDPVLQEKLQTLLKAYQDVVPEDAEAKPPYPPPRAIDHEIETIPGISPPNKPVYRMSPAELEELQRQLTDLLDRGLIRPSTSPYASPIIFVKKKDGSFRLCVDYRALNNMTVKNRYPLPRIDDLLDRLHGAKYFTKIDMASGYHQVRLAEKDIHKSAFRTRYGHYEYIVLPFGMTNAPATFMRLMHEVFMPLLDKWVIVYLDDILVFSKTAEEHVEHVEQVLKLLREHQLYAKPSKCEWGVNRVEFLGHIVSHEGIEMDPSKVKAVLDWPEPRNPREVLQFKGLVGFYRRFIRDFSKLAAPLSALTGNVPFKWGEEERLSFEALKTAITSAPILALPDATKPFVVQTDASDFAIGAVLSQGEKEDLRVVAFESRKLGPTEVKYDVHDKELLAIIHVLVKWRHYLHGARFTIVTDNWATKFIQTKPTLTRLEAKWMGILQEFDCNIVHAPGKTNIVADALSRRPDYQLNAISELRVEENLLQEIGRAAETDPEYMRIRKAVAAGKRPDFLMRDGLLYYRGETVRAGL